jgi:hypothetical protein
MIPGETARHARQPIALQAAEPRETRRAHDAIELAMIGRDVLAQQLQLRRIGRVDAAAHPDPRCRHLEVQPRTVHAAERLVGKSRRDVGFERLPVLAEAGVASGTKHRHFRIGGELGCERRQVVRQTFDHPLHRTAHVQLVPVAVRLKPLPVVVAVECTEEGQGLRCEHAITRISLDCSEQQDYTDYMDLKPGAWGGNSAAMPLPTRRAQSVQSA